MIKLKLPIVAKLSSNQKKGSFYNYESARSNSKQIGFHETNAYIITNNIIRSNFNRNDKFKITMEFYFIDKRPRDILNFMESCKYYIDGMFIAINCDDKQIDETCGYRCDINKQDPHVILTLEKIK